MWRRWWKYKSGVKVSGWPAGGRSCCIRNRIDWKKANSTNRGGRILVAWIAFFVRGYVFILPRLSSLLSSHLPPRSANTTTREETVLAFRLLTTQATRVFIYGKKISKKAIIETACYNNLNGHRIRDNVNKMFDIVQFE